MIRTPMAIGIIALLLTGCGSRGGSSTYRVSTSVAGVGSGRLSGGGVGAAGIIGPTRSRRISASCDAGLRLRVDALVSEKTQQETLAFVATNTTSHRCTLLGYPVFA